MDVSVITYNLHGFNQGVTFLSNLCLTNDIIMCQEHWLYPDELWKLEKVNYDFMCVCTSAMGNAAQRGIRRGRPFGGVGFLVRKTLLPFFKCIAKRERFIAVLVADVLFINLYLPCNTGTNDYVENVQCILSDINTVILESGAANVIFGGDFNFQFDNVSLGCQIFNKSTSHLRLEVCDSLLSIDCDNTGGPVTYYQPSTNHSSFIDHFCITESLVDCVVHSSIIDSGENMSDHLPVCLVLKLALRVAPSPHADIPHRTRLRWDKADLISYYYGTYNSLSQIDVDNVIQRCPVGCKCSIQDAVDIIYSNIACALHQNSNQFVPRVKPGFYKPWWNETLSELKQASIAAHNLWKACSCPRTGDIFIQMRQAKIAYKNAIKAHQMNDDSQFSNDLHELLQGKDMIGFWKTWNAKIVKRKNSAVIDGETNGDLIAQKFATNFQGICNSNTATNVQKLNYTVQDMGAVYKYISNADKADLALVNVEIVNNCLQSMRKGKAAGTDGIEVEHLLHAHPIVVVLLSVLFNIMLKHGTVPSVFSNGVIVPVLKDKNGDVTDSNNYRGITISPCISKLFELCILQLYGNLLTVSPLQFGFQKRLSCSHAIYTLRAITDFYVSGHSTVNVALLDLSKAFDRVNHSLLFIKLMKLKIPPTVLRLLMIWYRQSNAFVRWGQYTSCLFAVTDGVRQGGVLSPLLFCIYTDDIIQSLMSLRLGCYLNDCYIGCIMYADDLILISSSVCEMQKND